MARASDKRCCSPSESASSQSRSTSRPAVPSSVASRPSLCSKPRISSSSIFSCPVPSRTSRSVPGGRYGRSGRKRMRSAPGRTIRPRRVALPEVVAGGRHVNDGGSCLGPSRSRRPRRNEHGALVFRSVGVLDRGRVCPRSGVAATRRSHAACPRNPTLRVLRRQEHYRLTSPCAPRKDGRGGR